jgi:hypothetical protein
MIHSFIYLSCLFYSVLLSSFHGDDENEVTLVCFLFSFSMLHSLGGGGEREGKGKEKIVYQDQNENRIRN